MALTAYPTVVFNSSTGSDTAASGAGPATALSGSANASTSGASTTVTLGGSPDLSGVATDGTAVLWLKGRGFYRIDTVDNGADTVVIETAVNVATACDWAIGGKRATITNADSRVLFLASSAGVGADSGQGGAGGGWTIQAENDGALAITTNAIPYQCSGGGTNMPLALKGDSASTRRVCDQSANDAHFTASSSLRLVFENIQFTNTNGTKTSANVFSLSASATYVAKNCVFGHATNSIRSACTRTSNSPILYLYDCAVISCTSSGLGGSAANMTIVVDGCDISNNAGSGINGSTVTAINSIIAHNTTNGILATSTLQIKGCTIDQNGANGAETSLNNVSNTSYVINSFISGHPTAGDFGLKFTGSTPHSPILYNNVFNNNDTDVTSGVTVDSSNQIDVDPGYVNSASGTRNYTPTNTALLGDALPTSGAGIGAGQSGSTTYRYPGAVQPGGNVSGYMANMRGNTQ